ncbi:hypothetical protein PCANC_23646 [Puccinia coronata f. sp. avenae]|uniref:Uncharacterized protein n=1 Tax=Puccinia coronata f. sp. avenae TaxID=200324 RepID=A0A2N5TQQ0_9BASI|nr:hypothetical protein PCANC_23646 [Puccinia coronata f. sp. avenae]
MSLSGLIISHNVIISSDNVIISSDSGCQWETQAKNKWAILPLAYKYLGQTLPSPSPTLSY